MRLLEDPRRFSPCIIYYLLRILRIKLGFQNKDNDKYMAESKARLSDSRYVEKLRKYGYKV